jgi:nucleotide-binding universal stress UspA family protein
MKNPEKFSAAIDDFQLARRRGTLQDLVGRILGRSQRLLAFEEIRELVGEEGLLSRGLQEIQLDAIVGSVDRYQDFTRSFLPKQVSQSERWARIRLLAETSGFPPIEVYQVGEVYFVLDGHHRVSVAREMGSKSIQAYVSEVPSKVAFSPEDDADELLVKAEEIRFMKDTQLDQTRPDIGLHLTSAAGYRVLREHIASHQVYMGMVQKKEVSVQAAAVNWMDTVYITAVAAIRRNRLTREFRGRTEGDLYLWIITHKSALAEELGWELETEEAAQDLRDRFSRRLPQLWKRLRSWIIDISTPDTLESGPRTGTWRDGRDTAESKNSIFRRILVGVSAEDRSWRAVDQAALIAKREKGRLRGLHVNDGDKSKKVRQAFDKRLTDLETDGRLVVEQGEVARLVERRSRWSDLVVLHLEHPPGDQPMDRVRSGMRELIQRIPRPLLLVSRYSEMRHGLLAFDGSPKAMEALYLAAYVQLKWDISITVLTGHKNQEDFKWAQKQQFQAQAYLSEKHVKANYQMRAGKVHQSILDTANERECDLLLMGGYGSPPVLEIIQGSTVDRVLQEFKGASLICR